MADLVLALVSILVAGVILRFTYALGRDAAQQEAFETISTLREQLRRASLDNKRMAEHLRRRDGRFNAQVEVDL